ncbi:hypothetical protein FRB96_002532 [Tulasnella sp. 330]|nr:hypothetical protein FRB96_002532 [Tulasnella sp. 330]
MNRLLYSSSVNRKIREERKVAEPELLHAINTLDTHDHSPIPSSSGSFALTVPMAPDPQDEFELDWGDGEADPEVQAGNSKMDLDDDGVDVVSLGDGEDDSHDYHVFHEQQSHSDQHQGTAQVEARPPSSSKAPSLNMAAPLSRTSSEAGKPLPASLPQRPPSQVSAVTSSSNLLAASAMAPPKATTNGNGLLPDWEPRTARSGGGTYYYNVKTQKSTWTKPVKSEEPQTPSRTSASPTALRRDRLAESPAMSLSNPPSLPPRPGMSTIAKSYRPDRSLSPPGRARGRRGGRSRSRSREHRHRKTGHERERDIPQKPPLSYPADIIPARRPYSPPPTRGIDSYRPPPSPEPQPRHRLSSSSPPPSRSGRTGFQDRDVVAPPDSSFQSRGRLSPPSNSAITYEIRRNKTRELTSQPNWHRSLSPPMRSQPLARSRSPPDTRRPLKSSPRGSTVLPQKRREDVISGSDRDVYIDSRCDRDRGSDSNIDVKRRRIEIADDDSRDTRQHRPGDSSKDWDSLASSKSSKAELPLDEISMAKRPPLPPQGERFVASVIMPSRGVDHRDHVPPRINPIVIPPTVATISEQATPRLASAGGERPSRLEHENTSAFMPPASAAVAAAYGKRQALLVGSGALPQQQAQHSPSAPSPMKDASHPNFAGGPRLPPSGPAAGITRGGRYGSTILPVSSSSATSDRDRDRDFPPRAPADRGGERELPRAPRAMHKLNDDRHYRPEREAATREREARLRMERPPPVPTPSIRQPSNNVGQDQRLQDGRRSQTDRGFPINRDRNVDMKYEASKEMQELPNLGTVHPSRLQALAKAVTTRAVTSPVISAAMLSPIERAQTSAAQKEPYHTSDQHANHPRQKQSDPDISEHHVYHQPGWKGEDFDIGDRPVVPQPRPRTRFDTSPLDRREQLPDLKSLQHPEQQPYRHSYDGDRVSGYSTHDVHPIPASPRSPIRGDFDDLHIDMPYRESALYQSSLHQQMALPQRRRASPSPPSPSIHHYHEERLDDVRRPRSPPPERSPVTLIASRRDSVIGIAVGDTHHDDGRQYQRESHMSPVISSRFGDNVNGITRPHTSDILPEARGLNLNERRWDREIEGSGSHAPQGSSPRFVDEMPQGPRRWASTEADYELEVDISRSSLERLQVQPQLRRVSADSHLRQKSPVRVPFSLSPRDDQSELMRRSAPAGDASGLEDVSRDRRHPHVPQTNGSSHVADQRPTQNTEPMEWAPERRTSVRIVRRELSPIELASHAPRERFGSTKALISSGTGISEPKQPLPQVPEPSTSSSLLARISSGPTEPFKSDQQSGSLRRRMDSDNIDTHRVAGPEEEGDRRRWKSKRGRGPGGGR